MNSSRPSVPSSSLSIRFMRKSAVSARRSAGVTWAAAADAFAGCVAYSVSRAWRASSSLSARSGGGGSGAIGVAGAARRTANDDAAVVAGAMLVMRGAAL